MGTMSEDGHSPSSLVRLPTKVFHEITPGGQAKVGGQDLTFLEGAIYLLPEYLQRSGSGEETGFHYCVEQKSPSFYTLVLNLFLGEKKKNRKSLFSFNWNISNVKCFPFSEKIMTLYKSFLQFPPTLKILYFPSV
jgi:hypothetical protein